jgi:glycosyltransferase involved in cell wall biosynthesis
MITVAVASYNHAPYVRECLLSICSQTYSDIELCWIDDCSSDGSFDIVVQAVKEPEIAARLHRPLLRRNTRNRGAAFSLNLAARMGSGPLISFMNSDDFYHPTRLEVLQRAYDGRDFFMTFSNVMPIDAGGTSLISDPVGGRVAFDADLLVSRFGSASRAFLSRQISSSTGNLLVSRRLFNTIGGFEDLKYCHDWMFALQSCILCSPVFENERLYFYRLHPTNSFRSLGAVAESETDYVLSSFFESIALVEPLNQSCPSPRREPAAFWELAQATHTIEAAERVFFPYLRTSRLLSHA